MSKDLRKGASRATAVAVHEVKDGSMYRDPIFVIGSRSAFGDRGVVPISSRVTAPAAEMLPPDRARRAVLLLAAFAHDIGKAGRLFQQKMDRSHDRPKERIGDAVRHETLSAAVWDAVFGGCDDDAFVRKLGALGAEDVDAGWVGAERVMMGIYNGAARKEALPFRFLKVDGLVRDIGLLILSHHRLPGSGISSSQGLNGTRHVNPKADKPRKDDFRPAEGEPFWHDEGMLRSVRDLAADLEHRHAGMSDLTLRTCLMLADHLGSSLKEASPRRPEHVANLKDGAWADDLATHTRKVMSRSRAAFRGLVLQRDSWPSLRREACPPPLLDMSATGRFAWQAEAAAESARAAAAGGGFFACVLSGTGTGKTRGVPAMLAAATYADPDPRRRGLRFSLGLGLRTLASQSARSYVEDLGFSSADVRFLVGTPVIEMGNDTDDADDGSESGTLSVDFTAAEVIADECEPPRSWHPEDDPPAFMEEIARGHDVKGILASPVLVCTIDQLASSAAPMRSGHLIPSVRIMTSDLVIDEIDQFSAEDLIVIYRLVRQAAASGRRVVLASATLPRDVAGNAWAAYRAGWADHAAGTGTSERAVALVTGDRPGSLAWGEAADLGALYDRCARSQSAPIISRVSDVVDAGRGWDGAMSAIVSACARGHDMNATLIDGMRVSVGFVRLSKVRHVMAAAGHVARLPAEEGLLRKTVCLHSRMTLGGRALIEGALRRMLDRKGEDPSRNLKIALEEVGAFAEAREAGASEISLIVICSSVIETGNDLDFDYAVLDPTDARSVAQAAGRVRRHRSGPPPGQNVFLLSKPLVVTETGELSYPGIETPLSAATYVKNMRLGPERESAETLLGDMTRNISPEFILDRREGACPSADREAELRTRFVTDGPVAGLEKTLGNIVLRYGADRLDARRFRRRTAPETTFFLDEIGIWTIPGRKGTLPHGQSRHVTGEAPPTALFPNPFDASCRKRRDLPIRLLSEVSVAAPEDAFRQNSASFRLDPFYGGVVTGQDPDRAFGRSS